MLAAILRWTLAGARLQVAARQDVNTQSADILAEPRRPLRIIKSSPLARRTRNVLPFAKTTCLLTGGWTATLEVVVARRCAKTMFATLTQQVRMGLAAARLPAAARHPLTIRHQVILALIQTARRASLKPEKHGAGMSWGVSRARLMMSRMCAPKEMA